MKEIKRKRFEILQKIDLLNKKRCDNCAGYQGNESNTIEVMQCKCDAATKIRKLGKTLDKLLTERSWESELRHIKKKKSITVNEYLDLYFLEVDDVEIRKMLNVSQAPFGRWKKEVGLTGLKNTSEKKIQEIRKLNGHKTYMKVYGRAKV